MQKFLLGTIFVLLLAGVSVGAAGYPQEQCRSPRGGYCASLAGVALAADTSAAQGSQVDVGGTIAKFYTYGLSVVGLAALIMFVYSGILYMIAGENTGLTGQARKFMTNAIWGLILALISWLILFTINPDLVKQLSSLDLLPKLSPVTNQTQPPSTQVLQQAGQRSQLYTQQNQTLEQLNADWRSGKITTEQYNTKLPFMNNLATAKTQLLSAQQEKEKILTGSGDYSSLSTAARQQKIVDLGLDTEIQKRTDQINTLQTSLQKLGY